MSSAIISPCETYRYRLDRRVAPGEVCFAYFGVNGSTATADEDDHTVRKWNGFTVRNGGSRYVVGNAFAYRATDVRELASAADPIGPDNDAYLRQIIGEADVLIPCWGARGKLPPRLRPRLATVRDMLVASGKPIVVFGLTASGDPLHPLTLAYETPLRAWV